MAEMTRWEKLVAILAGHYIAPEEVALILARRYAGSARQTADVSEAARLHALSDSLYDVAGK